MAKFDSVDRLMQQAAEPAAGGKAKAEPAAPDSRAELQSGALPEPGSPLALGASPVPAAPGRLGRQLLGNLDPFVPVLSRALQSFPHTGVQAVGRTVQAAERFLPLLKLFAGTSAAAAAPAASAPVSPAEDAGKQAALEGEVKALRERVETQEDQLRRLREGLERTVAEQGTLAHLAHQAQDRSRLLTAGMIILLLLVITQTVLLTMALRR